MKLLSVVLVVFILLFSFQKKKENIVRMNEPSISAEIQSIETLETNIKDTIPGKTLKIYYAENGLPIKYSRNILTGVCIEGECRLLQITLFWNISGRYLGFELAKGEYLSKTEHDPFSPKEYDRLHELLGDANSALANYTIEELIPARDSTYQSVDAVSSATIDAVLDYIVEGAVYTSYTMWHIVYGPTKREIEKLTSDRLDAALTLQIVNSNVLKDQVWVLNHISAGMELSLPLQNKLLKLIKGKDIYLAERALNAFKAEQINQNIQLELVRIYSESDFLKKRLILQKLKEIENLNPEIIQFLTPELKTRNGTLIKSILELFQAHSIKDEQTISEVANLLKSENRYISDLAFRYLNCIENLDRKIKKQLSKYTG